MRTNILPAALACRCLLAALAAAGLSATAFALNVAGPAYGGAGLSGVNAAATLGAFGTSRQNSGTTANINDGNPTTRVDTFFSGNSGTYSFVGIRWPFLCADSVRSLTFSMACFADGGWFGFPVATPGPGGALNSGTHLREPAVQVTTDGGVTWTGVAATSDSPDSKATASAAGQIPIPIRGTLRSRSQRRFPVSMASASLEKTGALEMETVFLGFSNSESTRVRSRTRTRMESRTHGNRLTD